MVWVIVGQAQTGNTLCWNHDFTYDTCCGESQQAGCWTEQHLTPEFCCSPPGSLLVAIRRKDILRFQLLLNLTAHAAACLVQGQSCSCEHDLLERLCPLLAPINVNFGEWLRTEWMHSDKQGECDYSHELVLGLSLMELLGTVSKHFGLIEHDTIVQLHSIGSRHLQQLMLLRSWQRVGPMSSSAVDGWARKQSRLWTSHLPVHIAMVASMGKPAFGTKSLAGIRSALTFALQRPLSFHLFVDQEGLRDVSQALDKLEPWLRAKGSFKLHVEDTSRGRLGSLLRSVLPSWCLGINPYYGDQVWLRYFVHELLVDAPEVEICIFVDAGDFIFLEDPAKLLQQARFGDKAVVAAPFRMKGETQARTLAWCEGAMTLQVFNLERMRRADFTQAVARSLLQAFAEHGSATCSLGESRMVEVMLQDSQNHELWSALPISWSYEPLFSEVPGQGLRDVWNSSMWKHRVHQGLVDFTQFTVHCPSFLEAMLRLVFARAPASRELLAAAVEWGKFQHRLEVEAGLYEDPYGQVMACGERVLGLHLVANLKAVPWAQALLNFWVGERVWEGYDDSPWPKHERDLAVAEPETRRTEW